MAHRVRQYLEGVLPFDRLCELVPDDTEDDDVAELLDLIEHEPKKGGFMGASPEEHRQSMDRIRLLVERLAAPVKDGEPAD